MKNITVHQSDERTYFLGELLKDVDAVLKTHVFAPNIVLNAKAVENLERRCVLIGGRADEEGAAAIKEKEICHFNILLDEDFQAENSRLTAEGALLAVLDRSLISLKDINALIVGFGRTGAAVASLFQKIGVAFDVATSSSFRPARAFANKVIATGEDDLSAYDVVINTVPLPVISDKALLTMKQGAVYIELASKPAANLEYARYLGVDADIYPALPARVCPKSAAQAMKNYILGVLK